MRKFLLIVALVAGLSSTGQANEHWVMRPQDWFSGAPSLISNSPSEFHGYNSVRYTVWIANPTANRIYYKLNGTEFFVDPNHFRSHWQVNDSNFNVEFDASFDYGFQPRGYKLTPQTKNSFTLVNHGLDLFRK